MIASVSSYKKDGKDFFHHVISLAKSGFEVWSRIHQRDRPLITLVFVSIPYDQSLEIMRWN